jgi:hypothetical protein
MRFAAFAVAFAGTILIAADQGSFFERSWPWAGLALAAVGALVLLTAQDVRCGRAGLVLVASLLAIELWTLASWLWSAEPPTTLDEALRTPIYVAAAIAFLALAGAGGALPIELGIAAGTTALAGYALLDRGVTQGQGKLLAEPLGYANALGGLCAIGVAIVAVLGWRARRNPAAVILATGAAAVLTTALALTSSRGSWAALAAALAVAATGRQRARTALGVALALAALTVATAFTTAPRLLQARGDYWHAAWQIAKRHPLGGSGAGTFDLGWAAYGDVARWGTVLDAHGLYIETLAELGVVGLILVLGLLAPAVSALRSPAAGAALAGGIAYLVHTGLDWDWEMSAVTVVGLACLAAAVPVPAEPLAPRLRVTLLVLEGAVAVTYVVDLIVRIA